MSFFTRLGLLALLTSLAPAISLAASQSDTATPSEVRHLSGVIEVSAEGIVESVELKARRLRPSLVKRIEAAVREFRFEPMIVDGEPRSLRTSMNLKLEQFKGPHGPRVVLTPTAFGQPRVNAPQVPTYPISQLRNRLGADVDLLVTVRNDGSVSTAEPLRGRVYGLHRGSGENAHRGALNVFVSASRAAVQQWQFEYLPPVGSGEVHRLIVPVAFRMDGSRPADPRRAPPAIEFDALKNLRAEVAQADSLRAALGDATAALSLREDLIRLDGNREVEL